MITREEILQKRELILRAAEQHGARDIRIFGSVARNEATTASDIDVLVHMDRERSLLDRIALIQELQDLLQCKVDVVNDRALDPVIRDHVLAEAVPL